jgi:uncharacterized SAM-binding protein YcdF (DUF218 family)
MNNPGRRKRVRIIVAGLMILLGVIFAVNAGRMLVIDAPEKSDVIIVLAGETDRRPVLALQLFDHGYAKRVYIDVNDGAKIYEYTEADLAEKYIHDLPEAASLRVCQIEGLSTRDESHDVEKCLAQEQADRVLIVTSDFHTRRALSIFRHELRGKSFSIAAAHDGTQFGTRWWTHREWAKTCLYEWLRLLWWYAVDRWR